MVDLTASSAHARTILARIGRRSARTARETASSSATRLARASSMTASHVSRLLCRTTAPWCAAARANDERRRRRSRWVSTHAQYERRRILRCASLRIASALALAFLARSTNPPAHRSNARKHSRSALCALATPRFSRRSRRSSAHLAQTANDALRVRPANALPRDPRERVELRLGPRDAAPPPNRAAEQRATVRRSFEGRSKVSSRTKRKTTTPKPNRADERAIRPEHAPSQGRLVRAVREPVEAKGLRENAPVLERDATRPLDDAEAQALRARLERRPLERLRLRPLGPGSEPPREALDRPRVT